jgi:hypothetical protein
MRSEQIKDLANPRRLYLVEHKVTPAGLNIVAEHRYSAHPLTLLPRGRHLIPCALADDFSLKLSEGQQDVEG